MADDDINKAENFMNSLNRPRQTEQVENIDDLLSALLTSSLSAPPAEDINDLDDISCEYSDLNNTIDELNSYLDVWEERHSNLRAKIQEALLGEDDDEEERDDDDVDGPCSSHDLPTKSEAAGHLKTSKQGQDEKHVDQTHTTSSVQEAPKDTDSLKDESL